MRWRLMLVVSATAISAGAAFAQSDNPAAARWAVVASDAIKSTALVEHLTVEASKLARVELVERESISKVLDESASLSNYEHRPSSSMLACSEMAKQPA